MLPNFSLENPDTFNAVFPWTQVEESKTTQPGTRHSSKLLQEKVLTHSLLVPTFVVCWSKLFDTLMVFLKDFF